jgi:preprotein translocase subunit SecF
MKLLRLAPENTKFPFMRFRRVSYPFSALLSLIAVALFIFKGMNFGIDFAGGTVIELRAKSGYAEVGALRTLGENLKLGDIEVQGFGNPADATLRFGLQPGGDVAQQAAVEKIRGAVGTDYDLRRVEVVGPRVSNELVQSGTLGVVLSIIAVLSYLWFRFEWQFAVGAVVTLILDLTKAIGFLVVTGLDFDLVMVGAILSILGYSTNDKVVVYDRMRENLRRYKTMPLRDVIDLSINETLNRTVGTSMTIFLASLPLVIFASGTSLAGFAWMNLFGVIVGTSSSIFIAAPILLFLGENRLRRDAQPPAPPPGQPPAKPTDAAATQ